VITLKARAEADYYLGFDPVEKARVTEADYQEWFGKDARGQRCRSDNPILCAKTHYGMWIKMLSASRLEDGWPGGVYLLDLPLRVLLEAFDSSSVEDWAKALFWWCRVPTQHALWEGK